MKPKLLRESPQSARPLCHRRAFTLLELVVVIGLLALLASLLLPTLAHTSDRNKRAACRNNLRQLATAMTLYAAENADKVFPARQYSVQLALDAPAGLAKLGLPPQTNSPSIWACPNRPGLPVLDPLFQQWLLGYQYFGGITNWHNIVGFFPSRSPVKLSQAQPYWTLAADCVLKVDGVWGGSPPEDNPVYRNLPHITPQTPSFPRAETRSSATAPSNGFLSRICTPSIPGIRDVARLSFSGLQGLRPFLKANLTALRARP